MTCIGNSIKVLSKNCQGLGNKKREIMCFYIFKEDDAKTSDTIV